MRSQGHKSSSSTITTLITDDEIYKTENLISPKRSKNSQTRSSSASRMLDEYIHNFNKIQTYKMAISMTENCTQTPIKREALHRTMPSTLEKEIKMAKMLLPSNHCDVTGDNYDVISGIDSESLATDELLAAPSNFQANIPRLSTKKYDQENFNSTEKAKRNLLNLKQFNNSAKTKNIISSESETNFSDDSLTLNEINKDKKRKSKTRTVLHFSGSGGSTTSTTTTSNTYKPELDLTPTNQTNIKSQFLTQQNREGLSDLEQDIDRTWRLVNELKADLTSTINNLDPSSVSLVELIEKLSRVAVRKEEKLKQSLQQPLLDDNNSLHCSDLETRSTSQDSSTSTMSQPLLSDSYNPYSLNGVSYTPHRVKYGHLPYSTTTESTTQSDSTLLTTDNISEAMRIIDERNNDKQDDYYSTELPAWLRGSDPRIISVLTKAQKVLTTPTKQKDQFTNHYMDHTNTMQAGSTPYHHNTTLPPSSDENSTTDTDIILEGDRDWEKPIQSSLNEDISVSLYVKGKPNQLNHFINSTQNMGLSGGNQPGSVETLKNMIFTLQGLPTQTLKKDEIENVSNGEKSLERAMKHLENLKRITHK